MLKSHQRSTAGVEEQDWLHSKQHVLLPRSLTFCDAPLRSPRSQRALLPVGSSSTSSLVLGGSLTCVGRAGKGQQGAEKWCVGKAFGALNRPPGWALQEQLYAYCKIINLSPPAGAPGLNGNRVIKTDGPKTRARPRAGSAWHVQTTPGGRAALKAGAPNEPSSGQGHQEH